MARPCEWGFVVQRAAVPGRRRLAAVEFGRITVFLEKLTIDCFGVADAGFTAFWRGLFTCGFCFSALLRAVVWAACCEFSAVYCVFAGLFAVENTVNRSNLCGAGLRGGFRGDVAMWSISAA